MASLFEEIQDILNDNSSDYDAKFKMLAKLTTKHEAEMLLATIMRPVNSVIRLKEKFSPVVTSDYKGMKILMLIIEQRHFNEIMAGTQKAEYRELKDTTKNRYTYLDTDGQRYLKPYDALRLYVGYHKNRDSALVTLTGIECDGDIVTFRLGKVLECHSTHFAP